MRKYFLSFHADKLLLLLYTSLIITHLLRIHAETTGYTSPDSHYYLELAKNLQEGKGFYITNKATNEPEFFTVWPVGYPLLIYLIAQVTPLSLFWSSKILNFLFLGLNFLILRQLSQKYAFVLASVFCSYTLMEIYSYTWSEAPFITGLLLLAYILSKPLPAYQENRFIFYLVLTCFFLFLIRYVGAFSLGVVVLFAVYNVCRNKVRLALKLELASALLCILILFYLSINYYFGNSFTGTGRFEIVREPIGDFVLMLCSGLLNEFLLIRKFRASGDMLFIFTTLAQAALIVFVFLRLHKQQTIKECLKNNFTISCFAIASLYLVAIVALRFISHFEDLDYRLLSPFSTMLVTGLMYALVKMPDIGKLKELKLLWFAFYLCSLLLNLPKQYILDKLTSCFI